jgi:hypothetical protein
VHHIKHREHGGGNEDSNLITLCSGHHDAHHEGRLAIEGLAPDRVSFVWTSAYVGANENHAHVGTKVRQERFGAAVIQTQVRDALVGLGWKPGIARTAVEDACAHVGMGVAIDVLIREALRRCPKPLG